MIDTPEASSTSAAALRRGASAAGARPAVATAAAAGAGGGPGCSIQIPMMHKHDEGMRSHYLTLEMFIPDAPGPEEIVVALGAATGGRVHPRIGNRYLDIEAIEAERAAASSK